MSVQKVPIDKLKAGMKLARPVTWKNLILLSKDTKLTDTLIDKIRNREIDTVYVYGSYGSQPTKSKEEELAQLDKRFRYVEDKPYMRLIKKAVREHIESLYEARLK